MLMAQAGAWVPAESMQLSVMDAVHTRMGAHDNILQVRLPACAASRSDHSHAPLRACAMAWPSYCTSRQLSCAVYVLSVSGKHLAAAPR